jgi:hypothetical protein
MLISASKKYRPVVSAIALSVCYLLASIPFHSHYDANHEIEDAAYHEVSHTDDGCHNFIYHGISSRSCSTHDHALQLEVDCLVCHYFKAQHKLVFPKPAETEITSAEDDSKVFENNQPFTLYQYCPPLRGPPLFV